MNMTSRLLTALIAIALSSSVLAEIKLENTAQVEKIEKDADGKEVIKLTPADLVIPGDVVVYTVTATNAGNAPADKIVINNAISEHVLYLADSAGSVAIGKNTTITFSVDGGKNYAAPEQLTVTENNLTRAATPADYTHIRWQLNFALEPQKSTSVFFKARLK